MSAKQESQSSPPESGIKKSVSITLVMGPWKDIVDTHTRNLLIARALNHCVHALELLIEGYLISDECVYLVFSSSNLKSVLLVFETTLDKYLSGIRSFESGPQPADEEYLPEASPMFLNLFRCYRLTDDYLIQLLTGKKIFLPYYDQRLERMRRKVLAAAFCSVIDYSGASGPVLINYKN